MRIGLCGAGGTGKGTSAKQIETLYAIDIINSPVEHIGKLFVPDSMSFNDITGKVRRDFQYAGVSAQIQSEWFLSQRGISYVSERSVFDFLAYYQESAEEPGGYKAYEEYVIRAYNSNPYDVLFYCCNDFVPSETGAEWKERDEQSRNATDAFLRSKLFEEKIYNGDIIELKGSVDDRCTIIRSVLDDKMAYLNG